jgi:hypothetical protein
MKEGVNFLTHAATFNNCVTLVTRCGTSTVSERFASVGIALGAAVYAQRFLAGSCAAAVVPIFPVAAAKAVTR